MLSQPIKRACQRPVFIPLISLLGLAARVVLRWFGGCQVIASVVTPGELIAWLFYLDDLS